ncbi:MAG TPA: DUF2249 domain-containing protein [Egicoccus sp.]|nr:DUF2249 domain-containing protein [Egicoccus sp.]HSK23981.1 DUF2249 domain-containing protein [Egicoccus sp.]
MTAHLPLAEDEATTAAHGNHESDGTAEAHTCNCHEAETSDPELDARLIPHAVRHAAIFGALDAVGLGHALVLVAPHDPLPMLAQLEQRQPGAFEISYLQRGPDAWRLRLSRRTL